MTPALLFPLGLAALAAAIVPLLIHLRRRTEATPTDFAALRWLDPRPRPRAKLRFDEWALLFVRMLLIALLALLLAGPVLHGVADDRPRVLVAPGLDPGPVMAAAGQDVDVRWLAPGFPAASAPAPAGPVPLASLIRQFDAELPPRAALTIVVPEVLQGVDAAPLRLTRTVTWDVRPGAMAAGPPALAAAPVLAVRVGGGADRGVRYLRAAAGAWAGAERSRFAVLADVRPPAAGQVLVWLNPAAPPTAVGEWVAAGGGALLAADVPFAMPGATTPRWRDPAGVALLEGGPLGRGQVFRFTRSLTPADMPQLLDPDFAERLRRVLAPPSPPPARVLARDHAPVTGVAAFPIPPLDLTPWLAVLIAFAFLAERWLATSPRRGVAP